MPNFVVTIILDGINPDENILVNTLSEYIEMVTDRIHHVTEKFCIANSYDSLDIKDISVAYSEFKHCRRYEDGGNVFTKVALCLYVETDDSLEKNISNDYNDKFSKFIDKIIDGVHKLSEEKEIDYRVNHPSVSIIDG